MGDIEKMRRIAIICSYDGTNYSGFQIQANASTIQEELELSLKKLFGKRICVHGCSRTDAGVHAMGLVAHFDLDNSIPDAKIPLAMNSKLREGIRVLKAVTMPQNFHSRFDSIGKTYIYKMQIGNTCTACEEKYQAFVPTYKYQFDVDKLILAAVYIIGEKDFKAFQAAGSDLKGSTIRKIDRIKISVRRSFSFMRAKKDNYISTKIADSSLYCISEASYLLLDAVMPSAGDLKYFEDNEAYKLIDRTAMLKHYVHTELNLDKYNDEKIFCCMNSASAVNDVMSAPFQLEIEVHGNGFLYNMVRILAGTLLYILEGRLNISDLIIAVENGNRTGIGKTMPAKGLYLNKVDYPSEVENILYKY